VRRPRRGAPPLHRCAGPMGLTSIPVFSLDGNTPESSPSELEYTRLSLLLELKENLLPLDVVLVSRCDWTVVDAVVGAELPAALLPLGIELLLPLLHSSLSLAKVICPGNHLNSRVFLFLGWVLNDHSVPSDPCPSWTLGAFPTWMLFTFHAFPRALCFRAGCHCEEDGGSHDEG
jgi:hypothetical protein